MKKNTPENPSPEATAEDAGTPGPGKQLRISSTGKRLLALLIDFVLALLLVNTLEQMLRAEHWDLMVETNRWTKAAGFYGSITALLTLRDVFGNSPGKFLLGMTLRKVENFMDVPTLQIRLQRNLLLLLFPVEGVVILRDPYARRLADRWLGTVVLEHPNPLRIPLRLLCGNILFFGFFGAAILLQGNAIKKTAAFQTAESAIRSHPELESLLLLHPELEEVEMSLDLSNREHPSLVRTRVGDEDYKFSVSVFLNYVPVPPGWEVGKIRIDPWVEE